MVSFESSGQYAHAHADYDASTVNIFRGIPGYRKWEPNKKVWAFKPTRAALEYLLRHFPHAKWDDHLQTRIHEIRAIVAPPVTELIPFKFKLPPFAHQHIAFSRAAGKTAFAWFMDMGTGKTKVAIDDMAYSYTAGIISAAVVVTPNNVKSNWLIDELPKHMPDYVPYRAACWQSTAVKAEKKALDALWEPGDFLRVLIVNVDAFSHKRSTEYVERFMNALPCSMVIDESSRIKTPGARRTSTLIRLGRKAKQRRIMTGTPVTQSPLDAWSQFTFLDPDILGYDSFYSFRNQYAIMGGYEGREVTAYKNLDELNESIYRFAYRVTKKECLDLPDKVYEKRLVQLSTAQRQAYNDMRKNMIAEVGGGSVSATIPLTKLLRFQQITGGFVPLDDDDGVVAFDTNPKIEAVLEIADDARQHGKIIIWARFIAEIKAIVAALKEQWGDDQVVEFHGGVSKEARLAARQAFQDPDSPVAFFVAQQDSGGIGLTLTEASTVVYFSNTFSLEARLQSEDRAHRIGQVNKVTYIDVVAENTVDDKKLLRSLRDKLGLSAMVTGDKLGEWI